jgi:hypothetical protein
LHASGRLEWFAFQYCVRSVSEIGGNQIIKAPTFPNIDLGCGTYQITVEIERVQKARLVGTGFSSMHHRL